MAAALGELSEQLVSELKPESAETPEVRNAVRRLMLPYPIRCEQTIIGSYTLRVQPYWSDIDVTTDCDIPAESRVQAASILANALRETVANAQREPGVYFSDLKCGRLGDSALHWGLTELAAGSNRGVTLEAAAAMPASICKLDLICQLAGRYVETSSFYQCRYKEGFLNYTPASRNDLVSALKADAAELAAEKPPKLFKAVKRLFSAGRLEGNKKLLLQLAPLLESTASKLSTVAADLETVERLLELGYRLDPGYLAGALSSLAEQVSTVLDIGVDAASFAAAMKRAQTYAVDSPPKAVKVLATQRKKLRALVTKAANEWLRRSDIKLFS